ncbi:MAG: hypothetical protein ABI224_11255 [Acetobacteraceae bacterium]
MATDAIPSASPKPEGWGPAGLVAAALLCAAVIVNPIREFMSQDDGWAYARSVEHLLRTGEYRLDAWSAANMPVQIYLAAGLAKLVGYSFSLLRISTLLLLGAGLSALYTLLRRLSVPAWPAAVLTVGFLASPLVLMLSFTFMSDIQFMSWVLIALCLYSRGFETRSIGVLLLGSLAAACAIGTRQFGIALIAGAIASWVAVGPTRRPSFQSLAWALGLPLAIAAWQLRAGISEPNFTQAVRLHEQADFIGLPLGVMVHEMVWRLSTIFQYVGLSLLPVFPLLISLCRDRPTGHLDRIDAAAPERASTFSRLPRTTAMLTSLTLVGLLLFTLKNSDVSTRESASHVLPLWWMLPTAFWDKAWLMRGFAASGVVGTFFLLFFFWRWQGTRLRLRDLPWPLLLAVSTGLSLLALHLSYVQLNDTYLVGLLPFVVLLVGFTLTTRPQPAWLLALTLCWSIAMLVSLSAWMRGDYNRQQAQWTTADRLVTSGIAPRCIGATRHWSEYHGSFDAWLAATHPDFDHRRGARSPAPRGLLHGPFYAWMERRSFNGTYQITSGFNEASRPGWKVAAYVPYRSATFALRTFQLLQRETPQPPGSEPCTAPAVLP